MKISDIVLGEEYKDKITGFQGIVTSKHSYINGCHQVGLSAKCGKGEQPKVYSFDVERIKRVGKGKAAEFTPDKLSEPGGPGNHAAARSPQR